MSTGSQKANQADRTSTKQLWTNPCVQSHRDLKFCGRKETRPTDSTSKSSNSVKSSLWMTNVKTQWRSRFNWAQKSSVTHTMSLLESALWLSGTTATNHGLTKAVASKTASTRSIKLRNQTKSMTLKASESKSIKQTIGVLWLAWKEALSRIQRWFSGKAHHSC